MLKIPMMAAREWCGDPVCATWPVLCVVGISAATSNGVMYVCLEVHSSQSANALQIVRLPLEVSEHQL
jgi:hypothetical protein